jgi:hypothetical protein
MKVGEMMLELIKHDPNEDIELGMVVGAQAYYSTKIEIMTPSPAILNGTNSVLIYGGRP